MSASNVKFERWASREPSTWVFTVFQKYNVELSRMFIAHIASSEYQYRTLGLVAKWEDPVTRHFHFQDETQQHTFDDIQAWSKAFNDFDNWVNLNTVMAMSSNLETYMSTVIKLALESDVGVLFGASKRIDGMAIAKHGKAQAFNFEDKLMSCTRGDWSARLRAYESIFGCSPALLNKNIGPLEKLRKLRNDVGHAFGRDIESSRSHDAVDIHPMKKLKRDKTIGYQKLIYGIAKAIDRQLLLGHIGDYQTLHFYHNLRPSLKHGDPLPERMLGNHAAVLKKRLGRFGAAKVGKKFCRGLISYYESL